MKIIIKEENFKWHLEAFASELFIYIYIYIYICTFLMTHIVSLQHLERGDGMLARAVRVIMM